MSTRTDNILNYSSELAKIGDKDWLLREDSVRHCRLPRQAIHCGRGNKGAESEGEATRRRHLQKAKGGRHCRTGGKRTSVNNFRGNASRHTYLCSPVVCRWRMEMLEATALHGIETATKKIETHCNCKKTCKEKTEIILKQSEKASEESKRELLLLSDLFLPCRP